jgi:GT2 family glycosyltransferase
MMNKPPSVAIIILNFNKRADVLEAIESALATEYPEVQVLVVDNASTDGSWEAISKTYPELSKIQMQTNVGASGGRNAGWKYVKKHFHSDYLFFLDDDAVIAHDAIKKLVDAIQLDQTVGIACGKGYTHHPATTINSVGIRVNMYTGIICDIGLGEEDHGQYDEQRYVSACGCFGFFIRAALFDKLGGFNEAFNPYGWEDVDLCLRSKRLGFKTLYVPPAVIHHKGTKLGRKPLPLYEQTKARNYLYLIREHADLIQLLCIGLCLPFRLCVLTAKLIRQGHGNIIASHAKGVWRAVCTNKKSHLVKREVK